MRFEKNDGTTISNLNKIHDLKHLQVKGFSVKIMDDDRKLLWEPSEDWIKNSNITWFIDFVNREYDQNIKGGKDLYKFSVENIEDFWDAMWKFSDIIASKPYDKVVEDLSVFPGTKWFPGAKLKFA